MRAFVWKGSEVHDLGVLPGDQQSEALAINDAGDVVGWSKGPGGTRAVLWSSGKIQDIGSLHENAIFTRARAINVRGEIVGGSIAARQSRAFIWSRDRGMRDLNALIPQSFPYLLSEAVAINNRGHIIATGHGTDYRHDAEGQGGPSLRVFILIPGRSRSVPNPNFRRGPPKLGYDYCGLPLPVASPATLAPQRVSGIERGML
jgi:probable HAF family extracellular repeat protein